MAKLSVALEPCDLNAIPSLVEQINDLGSQIANGDRNARFSLLKAAQKLVNALETPRETMIKHCWAQVRTTHSV
jgi:flagellar hook-associated protein FlgK